MTWGLLFVGHGTRDDEGAAEFQAVARAAADRLRLAPAVWDTAYLELREPGLATGIRNAYRRGVTDLLLAPVLLFAAGHLKQDIPALVEATRADCPGLQVRLTGALGIDDRLIQVAAERLREAGLRAADGDAVLFVGRGNRDPEALSQLGIITDRVCRLVGGPPFELGLLAGSGPSLETAVQRLAAIRPRRVVVLPYLLFQGYLTRTLPQRARAALTAACGAGAVPQLIFARHLGPDPCVAEVLTDRIRETGAVQMAFGLY